MLNIGNNICISYTLALAHNKQIVDEVSHDDPMCFTLGSGDMAPELEQHLMDLDVGQSTLLELTPDQHFGFSKPELIQPMALSDFADMTPEKNQMMAFDLPNGDQMTGIITNIKENQVTVDFNPPLAGKTILFQVTLIQLNE